jgi:hypothetical protein
MGTVKPAVVISDQILVVKKVYAVRVVSRRGDGWCIIQGWLDFRSGVQLSLKCGHGPSMQEHGLKVFSEGDGVSVSLVGWGFDAFGGGSRESPRVVDPWLWRAQTG